MTPRERQHLILEMECDRSFWIGEYLKAKDAGDSHGMLEAAVCGKLTRLRIEELKAGHYSHLGS